MSQSLGERIVEANHDLFEAKKIGRIPDFFAPDYVVHLTDRDLGGHDMVHGYLVAVGTAFPDLAVEVVVMMESDDRVAWQRTLRGTYAEDFMGHRATGRPVTWRDMIISRFEDGVIAEEWAVSEFYERVATA